MASKKLELPSSFSVLLAIRDAQSTRGAQRELLYALTLRARKDRKYSCYPSYETLAEDTGLNKVTLKRAAAELEAAGLIKRLVRRNRSNVFIINVALIFEQAEKRRKEREQRKKDTLLGAFAGFPEPATESSVGINIDDVELSEEDFADSESMFAPRGEL